MTKEEIQKLYKENHKSEKKIYDKELYDKNASYLLLYTSTQDENFQKCWALENLRTYSAKQNLLDGSRSER